eukprot:COSAG06_NODE_64858_length_258_cov_0.962264_1_plen_65_part_01
MHLHHRAWITLLSLRAAGVGSAGPGWIDCSQLTNARAPCAMLCAIDNAIFAAAAQPLLPSHMIRI